MQRTQSNVSILNAWFNLEKALIDAQVPENEQVAIISRPPTSKMMRDYSNYHSQQRAQSLRPLTGLTRPSTAITMKKPIEYQDKTATIQQSQRKMFRKKVNQRPFKKYGFDNIHIQKEEQEGDISEEELNLSAVIHTLDVDQIIDLYNSKCKDRELEYQPEHAVLFIEKFKKLCIDEQFICEDNQLGLESAKTIRDMLLYNNHFSTLRLARNSIGDEGLMELLEMLKVNNNIVHIDLSSNNITADGAFYLFNELVPLHSIISIELSSKDGLNRNKVSVKGCEPIETILKYNHPLQFLGLRGTSIQNAGFECILSGLQTNSTLSYLNVSNNDLNEEACNYMVQYIQVCHLVELDLSYNPLGNNGMDYLSRICDKGSFMLKKLNLAGCEIKSLGILKLFQSLTVNRFLEKLILDENHFSGNGFNQIEHVLTSKIPLTYLSMAKCSINASGADYIGNGIERNRTLKTLILRDNRLTDIGAECIFKGLFFEKLDLKRCNLTDKCVLGLCNMIKQSTQLTTLLLPDNGFHDSSGIVICEAIRINSSILNLDICENPLSYKYIDQINKVIETNRLKYELDRVPMYKREIVKLNNIIQMKPSLEKDQNENQQKKARSLQTLEKTIEEKNKVKIEQIQKTTDMDTRLQQIQQQSRQMDIDKIKFDNESNMYLIKMDDEINDYQKKMSECHQVITRLEKEIRGLKDQRHVRKGQSDSRLEMLRQLNRAEERALQRAEMEKKQLEERIKAMQGKESITIIVLKYLIKIMNKKYTSSNLNPKILDDRDEINFGTSLIDVILDQKHFKYLTCFLDTLSLINLQLSSKVFKIRHWRIYFKKIIFERLCKPLDHRLISQFSIDQKCVQFIFWDSVIDFKRLNLQYSHQYKYYSCQQSIEASNIQKDIDRTFSQHQYFKQIHNRQRLQRILIALSEIQEQIGYIQGFNQIAGCFLINGLNEQQTFWIMYYILKKMKYSTIFQDQFNELKFLNFTVAVFLRNYVPSLSNEFLQNKIDVGIITTRWFLVIFGYDLPQQLLIQVWNMFLMKGIKILIRISIAIFKLVSDFEGINDLYELLKENLFDLLETNVQLQVKLIEYFLTIKITNRLIQELKYKFETGDESLSLSFDQIQKKHYWRKGGDSARSLISSFNEIISEFQEEKDAFFQRSQLFMNAFFPKMINKNYLEISEGKKNLSINNIEKRPKLIKRQIISQQFKMSIPQSANGDQESNIYADELQSRMSPKDDESIELECTPDKIFKFSNKKR
ncbi:unnamed protein product [Paramecium pentaurelia]|uniref:Rab-GAP TBC domain-containing protein n=1 Tax=Paramecium pentaurelia TaxID=43138 RepID=A0A8S1SFF2_9CILI|nr:unnamed protein product [Paramecium pentaurelia]